LACLKIPSHVTPGTKRVFVYFHRHVSHPVPGQWSLN
jgi:hypothetical protein